MSPDNAQRDAPFVATVQLLWIPLGAGQHIVKLNGKAFEALSAFRHRRARCDIYHAALVITVPDGRYTVEMTPIPDSRGSERGVVAEGPVGLKVLGRFRLFAMRSDDGATARSLMPMKRCAWRR